MLKPRIQIVDSHDQLIGHKYRDQVDHTTEIYRSSCLWLENSAGEVLLAQRKFDKAKDPGKWGPAVAGTLDEGETYYSNIVKEIEEEIGLTGLDLHPVTKLFIRNKHAFFMQVYSAVFNSPAKALILQEEEVEAVKWVPMHELLRDVEGNPEIYVQSINQLTAAISRSTANKS